MLNQLVRLTADCIRASLAVDVAEDVAEDVALVAAMAQRTSGNSKILSSFSAKSIGLVLFGSSP